nr:protein EVI2B [Misgurnus anguillicaudatus]
MRSISCPLVVVFLFSLPWRPNGNLTAGANIKRNNEHIADHHSLKHTTERLSGLRHYSLDAEKENVVSLSRSMEMQHLTGTSESEHQGLHVGTFSAHVLNQRGKRDTNGTRQHLQTKPTETTESILTQQAIRNTTKFMPSNNSSKQIEADTAQQGNATREPLVAMQDKTRETPLILNPTTLSYTTQPSVADTESNTTTASSNLHTVTQTREATVQPNQVTHTSTVRSVTDLIKTTQRKKITEKRPPPTIKPVERTTTTLKTTKKKVVPPPNNNQQKSPGPIVASIICTTLVLMFIGIIYILVRKRKIQKKQLENSEWAGPSPFLDGELQPDVPATVESESVNRRGFGQISISKYLPQRLSKHLTLRRDTDEEVFMGDILQGSTFGRQIPDEVKGTNGEQTLVRDLPETEESQNHQAPASVDSTDTKIPAVTVDIKESGELNDDLPKSSPQDPVVKPLHPLVSIDLDSLSEDIAPTQISNVGNVPPAPPLP